MEKIGVCPSVIDSDKIYYKENKPDEFPDHVPENNNLFLQMLKNLRAHLMLVCEAATLEPHKEYLKDHGWSFCFNDAKDLCVLARLGIRKERQYCSDWRSKGR